MQITAMPTEQFPSCAQRTLQTFPIMEILGVAAIVLKFEKLTWDQLNMKTETNTM